ncbi:MAG: hypothetical protein ABJN26_16025 [Stappiaceae bacterium]
MCSYSPKSQGGLPPGSLAKQPPKARERQAQGRTGTSATGDAPSRSDSGIGSGDAGSRQPNTVLTRAIFRPGKTGSKRLLGQ